MGIGRKHESMSAWVVVGIPLLLSAPLGCVSSTGVGAVSIEPPAPQLLALRDLDGASFDLGSVIRGHEATVLIWYATECPCVRRYQSRMEALRRSYPAKTVAMVAIASNADDNAQKLRETVRLRRFALPIAIDPGGSLATLLAVRSTPTVVLLARTGGVRFTGWLDNERDVSEQGRVAYLRLALDALLGTGEQGPPTRSPVYGCLITRSLTEPGQCVESPQPPCAHDGG